MTLFALSRYDVADYVSTLITVYIVLIFVRIIMTWIPRIPYYRLLDAFLTFVKDVTDPYLNLFRKILPPVRIGGAGLDLSPMVGVFVLIIGQSIVVSLIEG